MANMIPNAARAVCGLLAASLLVSACTVGPNYQPDKMALPASFTEAEHPATAEEIARTNHEMTQWWSQFRDPMLDALVVQAIDGNYDLKIAGQRILAERALHDVAVSAFYPQADASTYGGDISHSLAIDDWPLRPGAAGNRQDVSYLSFGVGATWEIDLFGRIRRSVEAQDRAFDQSIEARRAVLLALLSELATDYVTMRATQLQVQIADNNIRVAQDALDLTNRLFTQGVGTTLQIAQAQAELDSQKAAREPLKTRISQLTHAIDVLLGQMPGTTEAQLKVVKPLPEVPDFPATLPSIVVTNRPDIRMAERQYAESTARIGVAVAQLYPNVIVPLSINPTASAAYQLFQSVSLSWKFLLMASAPLMHGGKYTAQVHAAQAQAEASRLAYRQTVLKGFKEVEDAMAAWHDDAEHTALLHRAAQDSATARDRAQRLYSAGLIGFLDVLTTERTTLNAQNQEALARLERLRDAIDLYVAMGAGWRGVAVTNTTLPVSLESQNMLARAFRQ